MNDLVAGLQDSDSGVVDKCLSQLRELIMYSDNNMDTITNRQTLLSLNITEHICRIITTFPSISMRRSAALILALLQMSDFEGHIQRDIKRYQLHASLVKTLQDLFKQHLEDLNARTGVDEDKLVRQFKDEAQELMFLLQQLIIDNDSKTNLVGSNVCFVLGQIVNHTLDVELTRHALNVMHKLSSLSSFKNELTIIRIIPFLIQTAVDTYEYCNSVELTETIAAARIPSKKRSLIEFFKTLVWGLERLMTISPKECITPFLPKLVKYVLTVLNDDMMFLPIAAHFLRALTELKCFEDILMCYPSYLSFVPDDDVSSTEEEVMILEADRFNKPRPLVSNMLMLEEDMPSLELGLFSNFATALVNLLSNCDCSDVGMCASLDDLLDIVNRLASNSNFCSVLVENTRIATVVFIGMTRLDIPFATRRNLATLISSGVFGGQVKGFVIKYVIPLLFSRPKGTDMNAIINSDNTHRLLYKAYSHCVSGQFHLYVDTMDGFNPDIVEKEFSTFHRALFVVTDENKMYRYLPPLQCANALAVGRAALFRVIGSAMSWSHLFSNEIINSDSWKDLVPNIPCKLFPFSIFVPLLDDNNTLYYASLNGISYPRLAEDTISIELRDAVRICRYGFYRYKYEVDGEIMEMKLRCAEWDEISLLGLFVNIFSGYIDRDFEVNFFTSKTLDEKAKMKQITLAMNQLVKVKQYESL
ncbi:hypothetical protein PCE1_002163 [Barthelona sp. PCE]